MKTLSPPSLKMKPVPVITDPTSPVGSLPPNAITTSLGAPRVSGTLSMIIAVIGGTVKEPPTPMGTMRTATIQRGAARSAKASRIRAREAG